MAIGALIGLSIFKHELRRAGLGSQASDAGLAGIFGGLAGAKLVWAIEFSGNEPFSQLLFSRGGLSWFGGLAGGLLAGIWVVRRQRLQVVRILAAATPALAVGHAIGRVGCFLVGDDYGRPSNLPWAVAFPEGLPPTTVAVHPTQLYEALALIPIAIILTVWRRQGRSDRLVLGRYLVLVGLLRFLIEFVRVNDQVIGPLTVAQTASFIAVAAGVFILRWSR